MPRTSFSTWCHRCLCCCSVMVLCLSVGGCGLGDDQEADSEIEIPDWVHDEDDSRTQQAKRLTLKLHPGDRFPLRKVIEKEVLQQTSGSADRINRLRIELLLGVTVEDVTDQGTKLRVRYDRVKYEHQLPGEVIRYDSAHRPDDLPLSIRAWDAMVGDGFAFWIGPDNQIAGVEGFRDFLKRCLSVIPEDQRDLVVMSIESSSGEKGVTDFIDNSIGLLPKAESVSVGDSWNQQQHIGRPVPMHINNTYTLKELTTDLAVVQIQGQITPSTTLIETPDAATRRVRMTVRHGNTWGLCEIFRDTGLPKRSRVEHDILMTVQLTGNRRFDQQVKSVTTIEAYPASSPKMLPTAGSEKQAPPTALHPAGGLVPR